MVWNSKLFCKSNKEIKVLQNFKPNKLLYIKSLANQKYNKTSLKKVIRFQIAP